MKGGSNECCTATSIPIGFFFVSLETSAIGFSKATCILFYLQKLFLDQLRASKNIFHRNAKDQKRQEINEVILLYNGFSSLLSCRERRETRREERRKEALT